MSSFKRRKPSLVRKFSINNQIQSLCFSPDESTICCVGESDIRIWNFVSDKKVYFESQTNDGVENVHTVDFSPLSISMVIVTGHSDNNVRLWNLGRGINSINSKSMSCELMKGHQKRVSCVRFSPDSNFVLSASMDSSIRIWDLQKFECVEKLKNAHRSINKGKYYVGGAFCAVYLDSSHSLLSGGSDCSCKIFDLRLQDKCVNVIRHPHTIYSVAYHSSTNHFVSASNGGGKKTISCFDLRNTKKPFYKYSRHRAWIWEVDYHISGNYIISCSFDRTVKIHDLLKKRVLFSFKNFSSQGIRTVRFSNSGNYFACGSLGSFYDSNTGIYLHNTKLFEGDFEIRDLKERIIFTMEYMEENDENLFFTVISFLGNNQRFRLTKAFLLL